MSTQSFCLWAYVGYATPVSGATALADVRRALDAAEQGDPPFSLRTLHRNSDFNTEPCNCDMCGDSERARWAAWPEPSTWVKAEHVVGLKVVVPAGTIAGNVEAWLMNRLGAHTWVSTHRQTRPGSVQMEMLKTLRQEDME